MKLKKDSSEQKLRGAYYTPLRLANAMVSLFAPEKMLMSFVKISSIFIKGTTNPVSTI